MQSQETQEHTVAFAVKRGLFEQDHLCEATLLQSSNPAEVKYSPPGKKIFYINSSSKTKPKIIPEGTLFPSITSDSEVSRETFRDSPRSWTEGAALLETTQPRHRNLPMTAVSSFPCIWHILCPLPGCFGARARQKAAPSQ